MKRHLVSALLVAMIAAPASAADAPGFGSGDSFAMSPAKRWSGHYLGVHLGYGFGGGFSPLGALDSPSGGVFGAQGGYDYQYNQFLIGVAADLAATTISKNDTASATNGALNWVATLRTRVGYIPQDNLMVYGTIGFAFGGANIERAGLSDSKSLGGYTLGVGGEYSFSRNWSALVEYRYTDFGRQTYTIGAPATATQIGNTGHTIRTGINYRF